MGTPRVADVVGCKHDLLKLHESAYHSEPFIAKQTVDDLEGFNSEIVVPILSQSTEESDCLWTRTPPFRIARVLVDPYHTLIFI